MNHTLKSSLLARARAAGFDTAGIARPELSDQAREGLKEFLAQGNHGEMAWMETHAERRADPRAIWPEVRSILMLGHNYAPAENPLEKLKHKDIGVISAYAQHRDYHDVMKKKMRALAADIAREYGCGVKIFVDTAPIMEKPLAAQAGLGWQGKHTCVVSREFGNWLFLGEIFLTLELPPDQPEQNHCGSCTRCLDICPTQAFSSCGKLDARKCIAYLTIEHKGQIAPEFRKAIGNRIYGCDDCLAVCPWNKFAQESREAGYHAREDLKAPPLSTLLELDDAGFRAHFSGSPVKRIGRDRFIRNVLIAAGNSGDVRLAEKIAPLVADPSPLVSEMAEWALAELNTRGNRALR